MGVSAGLVTNFRRSTDERSVRRGKGDEGDEGDEGDKGDEGDEGDEGDKGDKENFAFLMRAFILSQLPQRPCVFPHQSL
ncbi:MAG: hypothetical protein SWY16_08480 [Cyanobacteriota bacterium]|nr:hypothetical protein [Cyanobacteriota bacterium]